MREQLRKQADAEAVHVPACPVPGLVLVEADIGVDRGLADVKAPPADTAGILQQRDIERVVRTLGAQRRRAQPPCRALGLRHPFRQVKCSVHRAMVAQMGRLGTIDVRRPAIEVGDLVDAIEATAAANFRRT